MHRRSLFAAAAAPAILTRPARAGRSLVVAELFTSQSCSSCPPADALLGELVAHEPGVLALSFHVTYWDRLGWRDPFSLTEATERQRRYARTLSHGQLYTPQMVIQGQRDAIGSDRRGVMEAIRAAAPAEVALDLTADAREVRVSAGAGPGGGSFWLIGYDTRHVTRIGGGENGGRTLTHVHVVRSLASIGSWQGLPMRMNAARPAGEHVALLLQAANGVVLAAATA